MKVGIQLGKVKKFGIGWCIHHRMAAENAAWFKVSCIWAGIFLLNFE